MQGEADYDELLMTLVEQALSRPRDQRRAFIESVCQTDPALLEDVSLRVEWEEEMGEFLRGSVLPPAFAGFAPGELVAGRFRIVRELGHGGMGRVYEAIDEKLVRRIAIKCAYRGFHERLSPEARAALEVSHPNVCKLHEIHTADTESGPIDFLTMEFVAGETASGPLPEAEVRTIALQLCAGLAQAHRQGVIHGDIKAGNVILSRTAEGQVRAVLTDFGLARVAGAAQAGPADGGTPDYMAPELRAGGAPSVASDIYALGILIRKLLPERHSATWGRIIAGCTADDPAMRFGRVDDIAAILSPKATLVRWALAGAVLVIAALGAVLWWNQGADSGPPVRLAILPFTIENAALENVRGVGTDVAERLSGLRRNFQVRSPLEAGRLHVDSVQKARTLMNATHVLEAKLKPSGNEMAAEVRLIDAASGQVLRELKGEYSAAEPHAFAKALMASVTRTFHLRNRSHETVSARAYPEYIQGMELLRSDTQTAVDAIPHFRKAIELDGSSALPWAALGEAQVQAFRSQGKPPLDEAHATIERARSINPDSVQVLLASAAYLNMYGRYEKAIDDLTRATQLEFSNAKVWQSLGYAFEKSNRKTEAITAYRKAIEVQPDDYFGYVELGGYQMVLNDYEQAESVFRRGLAIAPGVAGAHMNLGLALMKQGRFDEAEPLLKTALQMRRTAGGLVNLGVLNYQKRRFAAAREYFEEAIRLSVPTSRRYNNLGDALRHLGQSSKARDAYQTALDLAQGELSRNPRLAEERSILGLICAHLHDERRATAELMQALAMEPDNAVVIRDAALAWEQLRERERALEVLRRAPAALVRELSWHPDAQTLKVDAGFRALLPATVSR